MVTMETNTAIKSFKKEKITTVVQLADWLSCSVVTARRRLKSWNAYTSYNLNGRYYTLPGITRFNDIGLWRYQGAFFSRHGNLKQTLTHLVTHSAQGLSGAELGEILGLQPRSFLSHFRDHPAIYRQNLMGRWIWFAADHKTREQQTQTRLSEEDIRASRIPSDSEAVMILVDLIKHPNSHVEQIARRLKSKQTSIDVAAIRQLLDYHGLLKKTVDTPASDV
jgi:hypothetical protein